MLKRNSTVLILTAKYGNGHVQVAKTLENQCKKQGFNKVIVCNLYSESFPIFSEITQYLYLKSFSIGKQFYRIFYYGVDKMYNKRMINLYYKMGHKRLHKIITEEQPDIIINTFPMIVVPEYRRKTGKVIPTFNVLTDFCLHKIWVHEDIDKYYVATDYVKEKLISIGVHPTTIKVTGIPIRSQFEEYIDKNTLYEKYNLDPNKKTLLIMAGAHGVLKNVKELCESFISTEGIQTIVVCGNNNELKESLEPLADSCSDKIKVLGYVERVDELYRIASCMITKPGGITLSEATALSVPVILFKPVPGQEKENAIFFEENGAAIVVNQIEDIYEEVCKLLLDEERLNEMTRNIHSFHHNNSAELILNDVIKEASLIKNKKLMLGS
ncbi:diglucosyl diacylglycerol synthase [Metabacillus fastidiosus]|uniref:Processive diacylglycerol beta-glucosyltransferase n=1 Tax=Metabacillus fastidiosus TaxID=1458 RepID=A0ABU6NUQ2_9BACI|nr:diglucosyl diacylglycerol synthase [Metabacillus fastidiosus]MED4400630.1 diglucosyl diacylglycerol synthase [Metabacillus fastidiosus]MED4453795.1 diglucosyl diacylglycerol synthase [Metabacillus fastidiosus]MED4462801.1 diglucosyl diacylglycerol synthase [Metabacillus fastidiosus]